jgi:pyruvate dehydrogenase E2 component (dihydrolipoamide acetyltransferase)
VPFSKLRRKVAERLTYSKQRIPHFYLYVDVNMSVALQWRRDYNQTAPVKATVTDLIVQATGRTLARFPKLNAHVADEKMILHKDVNIGVAVSVEDGLVVPVVPQVDTLSLEQISQTVRENAEGARGGVLKPQATGTFTISNLGMHGVGTFLPIINPPECAILGVGAITKRPCAIDDEQLAVADVMTLALACDHRAVDGTCAAAFLDEVKKTLEQFPD